VAGLCIAGGDLVESEKSGFHQQSRLGHWSCDRLFTGNLATQGWAVQSLLMRNATALWIVLLTLAPAAIAQTGHPEQTESLSLSCLENSFLGVFAHVASHESFPHVELRLIDPSGRNLGASVQAQQGKDVHYGRVFQLPKHPDHSKAVALEICNAVSGRYVLTVVESGNERYQISVTGEDGKTGNETRILYLHSDGDKTCTYRFSFLMADGKVAIRWLDSADHPLPFAKKPDCEPVFKSIFAAFSNPRELKILLLLGLSSLAKNRDFTNDVDFRDCSRKRLTASSDRLACLALPYKVAGGWELRLGS
jgi:hypothetical protein